MHWRPGPLTAPPTHGSLPRLAASPENPPLGRVNAWSMSCLDKGSAEVD